MTDRFFYTLQNGHGADTLKRNAAIVVLWKKITWSSREPDGRTVVLYGQLAINKGICHGRHPVTGTCLSTSGPTQHHRPYRAPAESFAQVMSRTGVKKV